MKPVQKTPVTKSDNKPKSDDKTLTADSKTEPPIAGVKSEEHKISLENVSEMNFVRKKSKFDQNVVHVQNQLYLARVHVRLKEFDKAKPFYDKVIEKEPNVIYLNLDFNFDTWI